jgi:C4-dicarboxylate-specific signal transduction histidine kinase
VTSVGTAALQALMSSPVAAELLLRADRASVIGSIARGMTHELRGPLQTLTLLLDPEADMMAGPNGRRLRMAVSDAVQRLAETVERFSRVHTPQEAPPSPLVVDDLLDSVAALQRYQRGAPATEIEFRRQGAIPAVRGVETDLRHVLLSLMLNAKEAMADGQPVPRLTVTASVQEDEVQILVEDNGPGWSEPTRQRAFEPFFTTRPGHLGIGLTVARWLVQRHSGGLDIEAGESGGARARLRLPLWRRGASESGPSPP